MGANANSLRKAAIMLMSLPHEEAAALMSKLAPKEVEQVSIELARLGSVGSDEQENIINEFANSSTGSVAGSGGLELAKTLVEKALGKNATSTLDSVRQSIEAVPFGFLKNVDSQNLLTFIIDEHPQTIALILCHVTGNQAADILSGLPSDRQLSVIRRIAIMGQTNPDIIHEVERGLENRISGT
jgi:flagellar motor switch protein FliG